jgi:outer membrane protein assembly factor BamA
MDMSFRTFLLSLLLLLSRSICMASDPEEKKDTTKPNSGFVIVPVIFYAPETRLQAGIAGMYYFRSESSPADTRPSQISAGTGYTQNNQFVLAINPDFYFDDEHWRVHGNMGFSKYPSRFYGIGSNTSLSDQENFTPQILKCSVAVQRNIQPGLNAAIKYDFRQDRILSADPGMLVTQEIPGRNGGIISGLGVVGLLDTRDNVFSARSGNLVEIQAMHYDRALGSDYSYSRLSLDLRGYWPVFETHAFAAQLFMNLMSGDVPFYQLSLFGGEDKMRGYYLGRYRDKDMALMQIEYRLPVVWRFGAVLFAGVGDVADRFSHFILSDLKFAEGFGIRYAVDTKERLNIRADLGFGGGEIQPYLTFREAF